MNFWSKGVFKVTRRNEQILQDAIKAYGSDVQTTITIEKMSELMNSLCKSKRKPGIVDKSDIAEGIADVYIMLRQLEMIYNNSEDVDSFIQQKLTRLQMRVLGKMMARK
jgi:hypothetical protein